MLKGLLSVVLLQAAMTWGLLWAQGSLLQPSTSAALLSSLPGSLGVFSQSTNATCVADCFWSKAPAPTCQKGCYIKTNESLRGLGFSSVLELLLVCECACIAAWMCFKRHLSSHVSSEHIRQMRERPRTSDFSVMIPAIPKSVKRSSIVRHFSAMYPPEAKHARQASACARAILSLLRPVPEPQVRRQMSALDPLTYAKHDIAADLRGTSMVAVHIHRTAPELLRTAEGLLLAIAKSDDLQNGVAARRNEMQSDRVSTDGFCCIPRRLRYVASTLAATERVNKAASGKVHLDGSRNTVFITFRSEEIRNLCIDEYSRWSLRSMCHADSRLQLLQGDAAHDLKVLPAPPLNEVDWVGINTPPTQKVCLFTWLPCVYIALGVALSALACFFLGGFSALRLMPEVTHARCMYDVPMRSSLDNFFITSTDDVHFWSFPGTPSQCTADNPFVAVVNTRRMDKVLFHSLTHGLSLEAAKASLARNASSFASVLSRSSCEPSASGLQAEPPLPRTGAARSISAGVLPLACLELQNAPLRSNIMSPHRSSTLTRKAQKFDSMNLSMGASSAVAAVFVALLTSCASHGPRYSMGHNDTKATMWVFLSLLSVILLWPLAYSSHWGQTAAALGSSHGLIFGGASNLNETLVASFVPYFVTTAFLTLISLPVIDLARCLLYVCCSVPFGNVVEGARLRRLAWSKPELAVPLWNAGVLFMLLAANTVAVVVPAVSAMLLVVAVFWSMCLTVCILLGAKVDTHSTSVLWENARIIGSGLVFIRMVWSFVTFTASELRYLRTNMLFFGVPDQMAEAAANLPSSTLPTEVHLRATSSSFSALTFFLVMVGLVFCFSSLCGFLSTVLRTFTAQAWCGACCLAAGRVCTPSKRRNIATTLPIAESSECLMKQRALQRCTPELLSPFFVPPPQFDPIALQDFDTPNAHQIGFCSSSSRAQSKRDRGEMGWQLSPARLALGDRVPVRRLLWTPWLVKSNQNAAAHRHGSVAGEFMCMADVIRLTSDGSYADHVAEGSSDAALVARFLGAAATEGRPVDMLSLRKALNDLSLKQLQQAVLKRFCWRLLHEGSVQTQPGLPSELDPDAPVSRRLYCIRAPKHGGSHRSLAAVSMAERQSLRPADFVDAVEFENPQPGTAGLARTDWKEKQRKAKPNTIVKVTGAASVLDVPHRTGWEAPCDAQPKPFSQSWTVSERENGEAKWEKTKDRMRARLDPQPSPRLIGSCSIESKAVEPKEQPVSVSSLTPKRIQVRPASSHGEEQPSRRMLTANQITVVGSSHAAVSHPSSRLSRRPSTREAAQELHDRRAIWVQKGIQKGTASHKLAQLSQQIQHELHGQETVVPQAQLQETGQVDWQQTAKVARLKQKLKADAGHGEVQLQPASSSDRITAGGQELLLSGGATQAHVHVQETDIGDMKVLRVESSVKVYQSSLEDAARLEHEIQRRMRLATSGRKTAWRQGELIGDSGDMAASPTNLARATGMSYDSIRRRSQAAKAKHSGQAFDNYISLA